jgi:hypothetical protein
MNFSYLNFGKLTSVLLQQINELPWYSSIPFARSSLQTLPEPKMRQQEKLAAAAARGLHDACVPEQLILSRATPFPEQNGPDGSGGVRELLLEWLWKVEASSPVPVKAPCVSDTQAYFLLLIHIFLWVAWSCCCC